MKHHVLVETNEVVRYVLLYRTPEKWRFTIGLGDGMACGALPETDSQAPFDAATAEFAQMLREQFGVTEALHWRLNKPDWWVADLAGPER